MKTDTVNITTRTLGASTRVAAQFGAHSDLHVFARIPLIRAFLLTILCFLF